MIRVVFMAGLLLGACQTTTPGAVVLPDIIPTSVRDEVPIDLQPYVIPKHNGVLGPATEFRTDGEGIVPRGCVEMRERDSEANC